MTCPGKWLSIVFLTALVCPGLVFAAKTQDYWGLKLSYFDPESSELENDQFDDPDNVGLLYGLEKPYRFGYFGGEADLTRTFIKGSFENQSIAVDTYALYLTVRTRESSRGDIGPYFKFKAGPFYYHIELDNGEDDSELSGAVGFGIGVNMRLVRFELEILAPEKDVGFVSLNLIF